LQTNFIILPHFKISYPVALGIDESVVPWELMRKKKQGRVNERPTMESLFFSFSFLKLFFYWVLLNNLAKVKSLLCKVILQNSLMKLFFIPFWMLPIHLMYANVDVDCEFSSLYHFHFFYAYSRISHVLYTCNNNIPNTLSIKEISSKAFQNFFLLFWMIIHFGVLT